MFHKIKNIKALDDYILLVTFENGIKKYYDMNQIFDKWSVFRILKNNNELFLDVKIDTGGYGISWNEELDLSCNELWDNGKENR